MNNMAKKKPKKKDGRLQKGEKKGREKLRTKKYKKGQQDKKRRKPQKYEILNQFSFGCFFEIIFWEGWE